MVLTLIPKLEIVLVLVLVLALVIEKTAAPLLRRAGTGQLRKDQALFSARTGQQIEHGHEHDAPICAPFRGDPILPAARGFALRTRPGVPRAYHQAGASSRAVSGTE